MTERDYNMMLAGQGFGCAVCRGVTDYWLLVDHSHFTGRVRGLLCKPCNTALGMLQDDDVLLRRALDYLSQRHILTPAPQLVRYGPVKNEKGPRPTAVGR